MTREHNTRCWLCGRLNEAATAVADKGAFAREPEPENGDASFCFHCGSFGIFDSSSDGVRQPTPREAAQLAGDPKCRAVAEAWKQVTRRHNA